MAIEYVRVRDDSNGAESSQPKNMSLAGLTVIDKPAVDEGGNPLPAKSRVDLAGESPKRARRTES